jgi:Ecdysteroid kinase-like family
MTIPAHPDDLTAQWLTDTFRATGTLPHGRVSHIDIQLLGGEKGMTGRLARVRLDYDIPNTGAPRSVIAKFSASDPSLRALIHASGFYEREVGFYQQLADQSPVPTPRCYYGALDPEDGASLLLLEEITTARNGSWVAGCTVPEAERALRAIAPLHAAWWEHPQLEEERWLRLREGLSVEHMPDVFRQTWQPFLTRLGPQMSTEILQTGAWLNTHLGRLCRYLFQDAPRTLVHNDYQADNLFFPTADAAQPVTVVDWQLATHGRAVLDVAWLLGGNLAPADRRDHELPLLRTYHALLVDHGVRGYTFKQCREDYRLAMFYPFSRIAVAVGFGAVPAGQERGFCEVLVTRYCQAIADLNDGDIASAEF